MPDLLQSAQTWLVGQFKTHASQAVTYRRGAAAISVQATIGRTAAERTDVEGLTVEAHVTDFLIEAADLDFGTGPVEPERGDEIDFGGETYQVLPLAGELFRRADPRGLMLRLHTRLKGNA